ncbi:MAG: GatB/YqeY domain-containing protein, partial [candidate division Zixibacteria bacterium]|nr:GatB/YqeY domain-containing protein [candidate division Zixibacteria bacterium]
MSLIEKIDQQMKEALKAGEKERLIVLRGLKSELKYKQIDKRDDLTEQDVLAVLASQAKKRREAIEQFEKGGRDDLVSKEKHELDIINSYLPEQLSEEKLREIIRETIAEAGAESPAHLGAVMKLVMPEVKGRADGKQVTRCLIAECYRRYSGGQIRFLTLEVTETSLKIAFS